MDGTNAASAGPRSVGALTHRGRIREKNEDAVMAADVSSAAASSARRFRLMMVADGMGGCPRGEVASSTALASAAAEIMRRLCEGSGGPDALAGGFLEANRRILDYVRRNPDAEGMGTTLVCALVEGDTVCLASVGDSRAYVAGGGIRQVTRDHTHVQDLVDRGSITAEESRMHPARSILTRALGMRDFSGPDMERLELGAAEALVLCSDGVTAHLSDRDILDNIASRNAPGACRAVIDAANRRGGSDNISLAVLSARPAPRHIPSPRA